MVTAEYPDTKWGGPPRAYGTGRDGKAVRLSVIHYTAGSETRTSAEDGAAYDKIRTDGTSCHAFHDQDSSVQEVLRRDRANSAFSKGNRLGIQHELCGTAQTRAQWLDAASDATLWRAARAVAKDCIDFGLEPRRLSDAEVRAAWYQFPNGPRGICGHDNITRAFPEDGGDHLDPGSGFPWDIFISRVKLVIAGEGEDMTSEESMLLKGAAWRLHTMMYDLDTVPDIPATQAVGVAGTPNGVKARLKLIEAKIDALGTVGGMSTEQLDEVKNSLRTELQAVLDLETLTDDDLPEIKAAMLEAVKQAAREGTG